ncbi:MAG: pseudaminic acid synthase [Rhodospirillales bacterium]|nr:MAG: pseudaminic acid synthase [Rhodospirillales bacterium]
MKAVRIAERLVGPGHPPFIVAELSANHNGSLERALSILEAAKDAGADAVKLQTYTPDSMTWNSRDPAFVLQGGLWDGESLYDLYAKAQTPRSWHPVLFERARQLGIILFSTPFDEETVDYLEQFDPPAYKIASMELTDIPLLERIGKTRRPAILSTGNCSQQEIATAIDTVSSAGTEDILLLHCISSYPAPAEDSNLRAIPWMESVFDRPVGLSDHTAGTSVSVASVALGACMIEKHFTLNRDGGGPDDSFSIDPTDLKRLTIDCREAWSALGVPLLKRADSEKATHKLRRSLFVIAPMKQGEPFTRAKIKALRPAIGLPTGELPCVLERRAARDIAAGTPLSNDLLS